MQPNHSIFEHTNLSAEVPPLPGTLKDALQQYVIETYRDDIGITLQKHYLEIVAQEDPTGLLELSEKIDIRLAYLKGKFPAEWQKLNLVLGELLNWLNQATKP